MRRLKVFIDSQNVYRLARRAFRLDGERSAAGQIDPRRLGDLLAARRNRRYAGTVHEVQLVEVRVYRGLPDGAIDPIGHGAATRQVAAWELQPDVRVFTHPIAYPRGWEVEAQRPSIVRRGERPREKGVDVQLAVDLLIGAVDDEYDVGIVFSGDSDLLPAIRSAMARGRHGGGLRTRSR